MFCSKCGKQYDESKINEFCPYCGQKIATDVPKSSVLPQQSVPSEGVRKNAPGAVAGMVCGLIGLFFFGIILGIIAIIAGSSAKRKIKEHPELYTGEGMAMAGFILGIVDVGFFFLFQMTWWGWGWW